MKVPFIDDLEELCEARIPAWRKILGLATLFSFLSVALVLCSEPRQEHRTLSLEGYIVLGGCGAVVGAFVGMVLCCRDRYVEGINAGDDSNGIFHLYLGGGMRSLATWFFTVMILTLVITLATV